jgi:uroporphyrinogen III methyltransferase / synthase
MAAHPSSKRPFGPSMPDRGALTARRIVVTRAAAQSAALMDKLRAAGALPVATPAIQILTPENISPLRDAAEQLHTFQWCVFTSSNAVRALLAEQDPDLWPATTLLAAVGNATARALTESGLGVHFQPSTAVAEALARELPVAPGDRVLWPHGDLAKQELVEALAARGAAVEAVVAYRTVADIALLGVVDALRDGRVDAITFTSASTVRHVVEGLGAAGVRLEKLPAATRPLIVCIGPVSAAAARECGLPVDGIADPSDDDGLVAALIRSFTGRIATA